MRHIPALCWTLWVAAFLGISAAAVPATDAQTYTGQTKSLVREFIKPVRVIRRIDGVYFVDFGRAAFGQLQLEVPAPANNEAGRRIVVRLGEKLADADHLDQAPGGSVRFRETTVTTMAGKSTYQIELTKADARRMPADIGAVMPFRYVELQNMPEGTTPEDLTARGVRQIAVHYLFDDNAADFVCSDEKLNAIWALCKYSIKATSYAGVFVDGDRERKPYEADAYIDQLGWYYCTDDTTLPGYTHEYLITHPTWPTEWIMFSVLTGWNDYLYTGDARSLTACYTDLKAKTLRGLEREDGLISTVKPPVPASVNKSVHFNGKLRDIVDWPAAERDGCEMLPVNTVVNAFHCRALTLMANMAEALGKSDDAAGFRQAAQRTLNSLNTKLVDPNTGLYVDGEGSSHSSLHANMFPLAFGLVPTERRAAVSAFVRGRGMACSVYGAQFLMDALFDAGRGADAVQLMEAPGDRSWRHMVEDVGTTITLEAWDTRYKPNEDWNHAWGAAPANLLPRNILGVEPLEPGYRTVLVWPRCAGAADLAAVAWARGKVPTAKGPITVDWRHTADGFHLDLELPPQTSALVRLPPDWGQQVQVDGKSMTGTKHDGTVDVEVTESGKHELSVGR